MAHGDQLQLTEGDAFLVYIEIYGYDSVKGQTEREMYRALMKIWEEIQLANRGRKVELIEEPEEMETEHKPSIWKWLLPADDMPEHLKIGFVYADTIEIPAGITAMSWGGSIWRRPLRGVFPR